MFKAVVFDIGQTLIEYNKPLNWSKSYRSALEHCLMMLRIILKNLSRKRQQQKQAKKVTAELKQGNIF